MLLELESAGLSLSLSALMGIGVFKGLQLFSQSRFSRLRLLQAESNSAEFGWNFSRSLGLEVFRIMGLALGLSLALCFEPIGIVIMLLSWFGCAYGVSHYRKRRTQRVDQQVEAWLLQLARAMQSAPSLSDALFMSQSLTSYPLRYELKRLEDSFHLGVSLAFALENMAKGLGSPRMKQAVVTMKSGLKSGGDLPKLLSRTGESMRELDRLGLVLRSKTAEGKTQALVISCSPLPMVIGVRMSEPLYFDPLFVSAAGQVYLAAAIALWLVAITLIRRILAVRL